jgi:hypothetical protein
MTFDVHFQYHIVFIGSPVRSIVSEDEYHPFSNNERDNEDDLSMEWDMVSEN